jgi:hypothetical protein
MLVSLRCCFRPGHTSPLYSPARLESVRGMEASGSPLLAAFLCRLTQTRRVLPAEALHFLFGQVFSVTSDRLQTAVHLQWKAPDRIPRVFPSWFLCAFGFLQPKFRLVGQLLRWFGPPEQERWVVEVLIFFLSIPLASCV